MKILANINVTFLVTISIVIGASYYVYRYVSPEHMYKLDNSYKITVIPQDNLEVNGGPKPPVSFTNEVNEVLRVCVYEANDKVQVFPITCWMLRKGETVKWEVAPSLIMLKVFKLTALDKPLVTKSDVEHMSNITISKQ